MTTPLPSGASSGPASDAEPEAPSIGLYAQLPLLMMSVMRERTPQQLNRTLATLKAMLRYAEQTSGKR